MIGRRLNHYEIVRRLGSGGMGDVYAARDVNLGREVALKILAPAMARDAERLERFRREATAVAALDHPNIVTIFSIEQAIVPDERQKTDRRPAPPVESKGAGGAEPAAPREPADAGAPIHFLTMQLVEGKTLADVIPRRGLPISEFFALAVPLADAVAAAHEKGITHRDLKPGNIMVTPEGRVKVLDFGLAKLTDPEPVASGETDAKMTHAATIAARHVTEEGMILGTAAYMSPEQAEGRLVDYRTDIFSLGIILYEMATGEAPFQGDSRISILSSVVNDAPVPVSEVNRQAPRHLARIIGHSLEKDAKRRFQSALDLRNELASLEAEVDSGIFEASGGEKEAWPNTLSGRGWQAALAMLALAAFAAIFVLASSWLGGDEAEPPASAAAMAPGVAVTPVAIADNRPSIAVLYFDNVSGDQGLDWLRTGLPEMLVTDLSQSRGIRVLTTDRVYGILADAGVVDAGASAALDAVGDRLGVDRVLLGSVLRSRNRIRIVARLQDVSSGEIVASETLDGDSEDALFDLVDELTRSVRATFTGLSTGGEVDRDVTDVTTSSVAALRLWVEAARYMELGEYEEARTRLLDAVEIDPQFAIAYAKLSAVSGNLTDFDARRRYAETALQHADRLTERERYYVEGVYYYARFGEIERAAEAYGKLLEFDPSSTAARNNLALTLWRLDRVEEAIAHFEALVDNDVEFVGTWTNLAEAYASEGRFDDAEALLLRLAEQRPESSAPYSGLAELYLGQGRYDDVERAVRAALRRGDPSARRFRAGVGLLTRQWDLAEETLEGAALENEPSLRYALIPQTRANVALYQGDSAAALEILRTALAEVPERGTFTSWLHDRMGYVHEARGDSAEAARFARLAVDDEPGDETLVWALAMLGRTQAMAGQLDAARATARRFESLTDGWPAALVREGAAMYAAIAAAEGNPERAATLLQQAADRLPPRGSNISPHCHVWFDLANAHIAAGNSAAAVPWLERIIASTSERVDTPQEYVYALYLLGTIEADRGNEDAARGHYELFVEHWGDGDLRRDEVEAARNWLAAR